MNKLTIIGNLTNDPELRTTPNGVYVCSFSVAVNRRVNQDKGTQETDFFRVAAWRQLGELCALYLTKGRKVCVVGSVRLDKREHNGKTYADMAVTAEDVEFLSPRESNPGTNIDKQTGMEAVTTDELPF